MENDDLPSDLLRLVEQDERQILPHQEITEAICRRPILSGLLDLFLFLLFRVWVSNLVLSFYFIEFLSRFILVIYFVFILRIYLLFVILCRVISSIIKCCWLMFVRK